MELTRQNIWGAAAAGLILAVALFRIPVAQGHTRALMRLLFEIGAGFAVAGVVGYRVNGWIGALIALSVVSWTLTIIKYGGGDSIQQVSYLAKNAVIFSGIVLVLFCSVNERWLLGAMIIVAVANLVFIALQAAGIDPYSLFSFGIMKLRHFSDISGSPKRGELLKKLTIRGSCG